MPIHAQVDAGLNNRPPTHFRVHNDDTDLQPTSIPQHPPWLFSENPFLCRLDAAFSMMADFSIQILDSPVATRQSGSSRGPPPPRFMDTAEV